MNLLKNNKKLILGFIIGSICASGITVYAYNYFASNISYSRENTEIKNVEEALNDLYNNKKESSDTTYNITENREYVLDKYYKNLNVSVPAPSITVKIINDVYSTAFNMACIDLPNQYKYFKVIEVNTDSNVDSYSIECWSRAQANWITINANQEYEITSDTDGYKFGTITLKSKSKTNSWSRSYIRVMLYNK